MTMAQPPPPMREWGRNRPPPFLLMRCGDVHPHPGSLRVAHANVTSLHMHWHTVAEWLVDVVLLSETRLTAVAQHVIRAPAGASGRKAFCGAPLGGGGGASGMRRPGWWESLCTRASQRDTYSPPKGRPGTRRTHSPRPCGTPPGGAMFWWDWDRD